MSVKQISQKLSAGSSSLPSSPTANTAFRVGFFSFARNTAAWLFVLFVALCSSDSSSAAPPRTLLDDYELELLAREPDIVTPVALAMDTNGDLLVIESHTHQRPTDYAGPASDRVRRFSDADGDGVFDTWSTLADGFRHAMNLVVRPDAKVVVITRGDVFLLEDKDGDGVVDRRSVLVHLDTEVDYPHNALGGFALDGDRGFYLGLGENFGGAYRLIGSDGKEFADAGGTGMIFHFAADGSQMTKVAQGFWNPFGLCLVGDHMLFAVDNDPDASPPCRLIHVVPTGDYGHRFEYGRAGVHPLQAWDGELPGTLPMICGTGEAPCAVVPHQNFLWVTSWGDHRLERYRLKPQGMSFSAVRQVTVQGDADFRPTGCVAGKDGSLYFADWVSRSYPVHGKGRIWRLRSKQSKSQTEWPEIQQVVEARTSLTDPLELVDSDDRFARQLAVASLDMQTAKAELLTAQGRLEALQALRWLNATDQDEYLRLALLDDDPQVRLFGVRWISDHFLTQFRDEIAKLLEGEIPDDRYYLSLLSALHWLDGERSPPPKNVVDNLLARELRNARRSNKLKTLALRYISPNHKQLTLAVLNDYIEDGDDRLKTEAIRTLALGSHPNRFTYLAKVAGDETIAPSMRADAVGGLASAAQEFAPLLERLSASDWPEVATEARRVRRLTQLAESPKEIKPPIDQMDAWLALTGGRGNAASGRRMFYSAAGPRCSACHSMHGRGGSYGPDLTRYGTSHDRHQALTAILHPSQDIAPRFVPWVLETDDGKTHVGMRLPLPGDGGKEPYVDKDGKMFILDSTTVEFREPSNKSIMPEGIEKTITIDDLADLLAYILDNES